MSKKLNERAERMYYALNTVMKTVDGKQFIDDLCEYCGYGKDVFVSGRSDQTDFNLGKQHIANFLKKLETQEPEQRK